MPPGCRCVRVREMVAAPVQREIVLNGRTAPARAVELRAEAAGRVVELAVERGSFVEAGEILARLDPRDREPGRAGRGGAGPGARSSTRPAASSAQKDF